jgi:hypothetical protein
VCYALPLRPQANLFALARAFSLSLIEYVAAGLALRRVFGFAALLPGLTSSLLPSCSVPFSQKYVPANCVLIGATLPTLTPSFFAVSLLRYDSVSDSLVGIMLRAKKRKLLEYQGDMLFQGINDDVVITVL